MPLHYLGQVWIIYELLSTARTLSGVGAILEMYIFLNPVSEEVVTFGGSRSILN